MDAKCGKKVVGVVQHFECMHPKIVRIGVGLVQSTYKQHFFSRSTSYHHTYWLHILMKILYCFVKCMNINIHFIIIIIIIFTKIILARRHCTFTKTTTFRTSSPSLLSATIMASQRHHKKQFEKSNCIFNAGLKKNILIHCPVSSFSFSFQPPARQCTAF